MQITYKPTTNRAVPVRVFLERKMVGSIQVADGGFAYLPRGSRTSGETFPTVEAVKHSIEGDL